MEPIRDTTTYLACSFNYPMPRSLNSKSPMTILSVEHTTIDDRQIVVRCIRLSDEYIFTCGVRRTRMHRRIEMSPFEMQANEGGINFRFAFTYEVGLFVFFATFDPYDFIWWYSAPPFLTHVTCDLAYLWAPFQQNYRFVSLRGTVCC